MGSDARPSYEQLGDMRFLNAVLKVCCIVSALRCALRVAWCDAAGLADAAASTAQGSRGACAALMPRHSVSACCQPRSTHSACMHACTHAQHPRDKHAAALLGRAGVAASAAAGGHTRALCTSRQRPAARLRHQRQGARAARPCVVRSNHPAVQRRRQFVHAAPFATACLTCQAASGRTCKTDSLACIARAPTTCMHVHAQVLLMSPYVQHMDSEAWGPDASEFRPQRWLDADGPAQAVHAYSYMPFSRGQRDCIGARFALLEAKTVRRAAASAAPQDCSSARRQYGALLRLCCVLLRLALGRCLTSTGAAGAASPDTCCCSAPLRSLPPPHATRCPACRSLPRAACCCCSRHCPDPGDAVPQL